MKGQKNILGECSTEFCTNNPDMLYNEEPPRVDVASRCSGFGENDGVTYGDGISTGENDFPEVIEKKVARKIRGPYKKSRLGELNSMTRREVKDSGGYYEKILMRRQKVLKFLEKDIFQICRPDLRRFMNTNHAYECLLPYHVFSPLLYEDEMFLNTSETNIVDEEIEVVTKLLEETIDFLSRPLITEQGVICDILLYHQQKYINSTYNKDKEGEVRREGTDRQVLLRKQKFQLNKRNTVFRLRIDTKIVEGNNVSVRNRKLYFRKNEGDII